MLLSSIACIAKNSLVTIFLEILHSRQFDIYKLQSSTKEISDCKRTAQADMREVLVKGEFQKKIH